MTEEKDGPIQFDETLDPGIDVTRRNLVIRALEYSAHGHGEMPSGFMSDAVDCLTGVLRDNENLWLAKLAAAQQQLDELRREHLRVARLRAGLSLGPAAEMLGLERQRLGDLEHGRANATDEEWRSIFSKLADAGDTGAA